MRVLPVIALVLTASCSRAAPLAPAAGPWQLSGTIFAAESGTAAQAIAGATLAILDGANVDARATTDAAGHYTFNALDAGSFTLRITAPGFVSIAPAVILNGTMHADFALAPE